MFVFIIRKDESMLVIRHIAVVYVQVHVYE